MNIHIGKEELVPPFNHRFVKSLKRIPENMRPNDELALFIYLDAFDTKMSYKLTSENYPQNVHHRSENVSHRKMSSAIEQR